MGPKAQVKELPKAKESLCSCSRKEGRKMEWRHVYAFGNGELGEGLPVGFYFPCEGKRQCQVSGRRGGGGGKGGVFESGEGLSWPSMGTGELVVWSNTVGLLAMLILI